MSTTNTPSPNHHQHEQHQKHQQHHHPPVGPYPLPGGYRWELPDPAATVREANRRAHSLRVRQWTPRPPPRGAGYGSRAVEELCREFGRLAVEVEEGWA